MRPKIVALVLLMALAGCSEKPSDIRLFLGRRLTPEECRQLVVAEGHSEHDHLEMVSSAQLLPCEEVSVNGVRYRLAFDQSERVAFIATSDPKFVTPEAIRVGTTCEEVEKAAKSKVVRESGWAFFIPLPCGWNAAFVQGNTMTEGNPSPNTKVDFFFVRQ